MSAIQPDRHFSRVSAIPFELLKEWGIKGILIDIDNTIASRDKEDFLPDAIEWIKNVQERGYKITVLSNGWRKRVKRACEIVGIKQLLPAPILKPLAFGFRWGAKKLGVKVSECVMICDQISTDIKGAKKVGMKAILVDPVNPDSDLPWTKFRRRLAKK